jgi:CrcB protein
MLTTVLWVALGGAIGSVARFLIAVWVAEALEETFPWGTLTVNVVGSFIIGFVAILTGPDGRLLVPADARIFVMVGLCGGFTTFSSFSLQTLLLLRDGDFMRAGLNVTVSVAACLAAVWLGAVVAAMISQSR